MIERQLIDKIAQSAQQKIQDEIGSLLGTAFLLSQPQGRIVSKKDFLEKLSGKQVVTDIKIAAESEARGFLLMSARAAIRIGGTLIMLPSSELDDLAEKISYDEEIEDSYGEITNIITAAYTHLFKEMSDSPCLFENGVQQLLSFPPDDDAPDHPMADDTYYELSSAITLNDKELGPLLLLLPALFFGLEDESGDTEKREHHDEQDNDERLDDDPSSQEPPIASSDDQEPEKSVNRGGSDSTDGTLPEDSGGPDIKTLREDVDSILEMCRVSIQEEVGAVIGAQVACSEMSNKVVSRQQFFKDEASGRQFAATFDVTGDEEGSCYLYLGLKDAIRVGCTLLMLPSSELEAAVREGSFSSDAADAYDEIVNVISRIYTKTFDEHFSRKLKFVKRSDEQVVAEKVSFEGDKPIADTHYYLHKLTLNLDGKSSGQLQMLLPLQLLGLESLQLENSAPLQGDAGAKHRSAAPLEDSLGRHSDAETAGGVNRKQQSSADVLVISDAEPEAKRITNVLDSQGISTVHLSFRDNLNNYLPGAFKVVLLVMSDVNEQSLGKAIKISTSCSLPLIAVGSSWTRSKVLKALRYGVHDILPSPATDDEISRKVSVYLGSLAA